MRGDTSGVVVAHAGLARALVDAAEGISGLKGGLSAISNDGLAPDELRDRVREGIGSGPAIVFTDLASGSCTFAGRALGRDRPDVVVVTGVNLPMLLDFLFHRSMEPGALALRVVGRGRSGAQVLECGGAGDGD